MKLILVNGKKRSGKDYFAKALETQLKLDGKTVEVMSFADPIKRIIARTFDITLEQLDEYKNDKRSVGISHSKFDGYEFEKLTDFRLILQRFGTEAMKSYFGDEVWVDLLMKHARHSDKDFIIVPDFRFKCEDTGEGITVKIRNDEIDNACTDTHPSENELNDYKFMYIIDNSGYRDITNDVKEFANILLSA